MDELEEGREMDERAGMSDNYSSADVHEYVVSLTDRQACALRYIAHERVIRCRDCAHFHEWDAPEGHYETCDRGPSNNWVGDDGFCAWAEPREE